MFVATKALTQELEWVNRFICKKATIPILLNVALTPAARSLQLVGTDLECAGLTAIEAVCEAGERPITVPARAMLNYLKKIEEKFLWLHADENQRLTIRHGDDGECTICGLSTASFPELPQIEATGTLSGLSAALPRVLIAISSDESRFTLNGALLELNGSGKLVSADGHRLSLCTVTGTGAIKVLLPKKALSELAHLGEDSVSYGADKDHAVFSSGSGRQILCRKLKGEFPDPERVLPKHLEHAASLDPVQFSKVLARVSLFADSRSRAVRLSVEPGKMTVRAEVCESGSAKGGVQIEGFSGSEWEAGFNATYLQDFLTLCDGKAELKFNKANEAAELDADLWRYVCMPMRI